ncbi:unnamed protein product [Rhizophagus irregularis]|nr:unnamed protein product [Rhizophagus irregularis]
MPSEIIFYNLLTFDLYRFKNTLKLTATLRSNVHSRFLAPASLGVNDYFKKTNAQDWKLKHYLNYQTTNKKRSQEDNYDNEAGPSNENRSRHEDSSYEGTYQDEPQTPEYLFEIYDQDEEIKVMDASSAECLNGNSAIQFMIG